MGCGSRALDRVPTQATQNRGLCGFKDAKRRETERRNIGAVLKRTPARPYRLVTEDPGEARRRSSSRLSWRSQYGALISDSLAVHAPSWSCDSRVCICRKFWNFRRADEPWIARNQSAAPHQPRTAWSHGRRRSRMHRVQPRRSPPAYVGPKPPSRAQSVKFHSASELLPDVLIWGLPTPNTGQQDGDCGSADDGARRDAWLPCVGVDVDEPGRYQSIAQPEPRHERTTASAGSGSRVPAPKLT